MKLLVLSITNACNLKCKSCLREFDRANHVSPELVAKVIPEARKLGYSAASFTGGEACMHPRFREMVRMAVDAKMKIGFVSNGTLLKKIRFLTEEHLKDLSYGCFSLDGVTAEINDAVRGDGVFDKVIASIKHFVSQGVFVKAGFLVNKLNMHQIEDFVSFTADLGVKNAYFMSPIRTAANKELVLTDKEKVRCATRVVKLRSKYSLPISICASLCADRHVDFCTSLNLSNIMVNPKGQLVFCCDTLRDGAVLGSLEDEPFAELYKKGLDVSARIMKARADILASGKRPAGFRSCEFCNHLLADTIDGFPG